MHNFHACMMWPIVRMFVSCNWLVRVADAIMYTSSSERTVPLYHGYVRIKNYVSPRIPTLHPSKFGIHSGLRFGGFISSTHAEANDSAGAP